MARQKEFDRVDTLNKALEVFWQKGYAATSTSDLLEAMQIGRQSLYDTFGDKRTLYLEALARYNEDSVTELLRHLKGDTPLAAIDNMLQAFASRPKRDNAKGCMGVNAISEFGTSDEEVNALRDASGKRLHRAVEAQLREAASSGEIPADTDTTQATAFVAATLSGMKISAKAGASIATLRAIASFAVQGLRS
ncbi:TetR/AcrR family transcriptional regulator [Duganella dendranthematis]|uniref:TetR/AcrR family transcriptional regulator n=1 Tax=Duganella dendranthematis TaxID=2728021 RepID=A0ABX6MAT7_9BURK|nr:TetR/AcrR family transcriptional regulator [Duganella dendranthematis]QJD89927.1 TetR/AcrR family transcriptional regulator [Duganella dendranthematis]